MKHKSQEYTFICYSLLLMQVVLVILKVAALDGLTWLCVFVPTFIALLIFTLVTIVNWFGKHDN